MRTVTSAALIFTTRVTVGAVVSFLLAQPTYSESSRVVDSYMRPMKEFDN